jgi:hypothetical protein
MGRGVLYVQRVKQVLAACALFALATALFLSRAPGPVVSPDAASYLFAAERMAHGQAPRVPFADWNEPDSTSPLRHFPPGFPALAAVPIALGVPSAQAARWVEALSFATAAIGVGLAAGSAGGPAAAALAVGMVVITPAIAQTNAMVLSEPAFLALLALLLACMVRTPERALRLGVIAAAAVLVRYAGVSLVPAAALFAASQPGSVGVRLRRAGLAAAPALVALGAWRHVVGAFRKYGYQAGVSGQVEDAWQTTAQWLVPGLDASWLRSAAAGCVLLAILLVFAVGADRAANGADVTPLRALRRASLLLVACYVAVVVGSRLYADPDIPFDWRLLAPLALVVETYLGAALVLAWRSAPRFATALGATLVSAWLVGSGWTLARGALAAHDADHTRLPRLADWLRNEGGAYALYTNDPTAIWHLAHCTSRILPRSADPATLRRFGEELARRPSAVLAFAYPLVDTVAPEELAARYALGAPARFDRASIWLSPGGSTPTAPAAQPSSQDERLGAVRLDRTSDAVVELSPR